jgi:hypothetical protein
VVENATVHVMHYRDEEVLMLEHGNLDVCFCGGVTFAWMLCDKLFGLNQDTTAALVNFLKLFRNKGLRC